MGEMVVYRSSTDARVKNISRTASCCRRGVSGGLRHRGAVPRGAGPATLAGRLRLPLLRPSGALRAGGSGSLSMQPVQEAGIATAGTIFHATKLPLTLWFAAIHLTVTAKNGISSVEEAS